MLYVMTKYITSVAAATCVLQPA